MLLVLYYTAHRPKGFYLLFCHLLNMGVLREAHWGPLLVPVRSHAYIYIYILFISVLYIYIIYYIYGSQVKYSMAHFSGSTERNCTIFGQYRDLMITKHFYFFLAKLDHRNPYLFCMVKKTYILIV